MDSLGRTIVQWWQEHRKKVIVVGVLAWVVFISFAYQRVTGKRDYKMAGTPGASAKVVQVGGLPVT